jgi:Fur family ferric uptake transcriptional regulator
VTLAPGAPARPTETLEEAVEILRGRGMRLSTARRLLLAALFGAEGPVSAVRLAEKLAVDETSVYRNLELFERCGLVRHVHLGHGPGLYVLLTGEEHEYIYCEGCHAVTTVGPRQLDPLRVLVGESFGHDVRFTHFALAGLCERCSPADGPAIRRHSAAGSTES